MKSSDDCDAEKKRIGMLAIKLCKATSSFYSEHELTIRDSYDRPSDECHALRYT